MVAGGVWEALEERSCVALRRTVKVNVDPGLWRVGGGEGVERHGKLLGSAEGCFFHLGRLFQLRVLFLPPSLFCFTFCAPDPGITKYVFTMSVCFSP